MYNIPIHSVKAIDEVIHIKELQ